MSSTIFADRTQIRQLQLLVNLQPIGIQPLAWCLAGIMRWNDNRGHTRVLNPGPEPRYYRRLFSHGDDTAKSHW